MAELVTWCRIMRVGPACATPCDDCRVASRRYNLAGQAGLIEAKALAEIHAEIDGEATMPDQPDLSQMNRPLEDIMAAMQPADPAPLTREALDALATQMWNTPAQHEPYLLPPGVTMRDLVNAELRRLGLPEISEEDTPC